MGISRLKKLITDDFYRNFTTNEMQLILNELTDRKINLYKLTGYPENQAIPRKETAVQILDYFHKSDKIINIVTYYINLTKYGFRGEKPVLHNYNEVLKELKECGLSYSQSLEKVITNDSSSKLNWGFLEEGQTYNFCFVSVDICDNSKLFLKYPQDRINKTYENFRKLLNNNLEKRNGVIWNWEGDGGLLSFHIGDSVNQAVFFAIDLLETMPLFNATSNFLDENLKIRIAINSGSAAFKKDTDKITSDAIEKVKYVEKKLTKPMTISVTQNTYSNINRIIRDLFTMKTADGDSFYVYNFTLIEGLNS